MPIHITEAEILDAIRDAIATRSAGDANAFTSTELAQMLGCATASVRWRIRLLLDAGRLEVTSKVVTSIANQPVKVPAYKLVTPSAEGET